MTTEYWFMIVIHKGFDGLEVAFQAQIPSELALKLEDAKAFANEIKSHTLIVVNGVRLRVEESGARGGYAYRCDTGLFGATWFFKKPNPRDPWGVRVSVKSLPLAVHGLGWVRADIYKTLDALGCSVSDGAESISRIDYAVDILAPDFVLDEDHYVMHARCSRKKHEDITEIRTEGHSSRTTSVTIGKNPGRQIIVYDKRAEVISKRKVEWPEIWNSNLKAMSLDPLDFDNPSASRIWRTEIRACKKHLKDIWGVTTWPDLDDKVGDIYSLALDHVRHTVPTSDRNRSRWPCSPIWNTVRSAVSDDLFEMQSHAEPGRMREVVAAEQRRVLLAQNLGLYVSLAGLEGIGADEFGAYVRGTSQEVLALSRQHKVPIDERLARAAERYSVIG